MTRLARRLCALVVIAGGALLLNTEDGVAEETYCSGYSIYCMTSCSQEEFVDYCASRRPGCYIGTPQCVYNATCSGMWPWNNGLKCSYNGAP